MREAIFLDTAGLIAVWDKDDQWHSAAEQVFNDLLTAKAPVLTTTYVMLECANAAARKPFREFVVRLRNELERAGRLVRPSEEEWETAWEAYRRGEAAQAGVVDLTSFRVMRRFGLLKAFTNDKHFRAAGFEPLY